MATEPREDILRHAARLFTEHGYTGTTTREIAEAVGIRQSSVYYYFTSKDDLLGGVLRQALRPMVDRIKEIEALVEEHGWAAALYALVLADVDALATAPHNSGLLCGASDEEIAAAASTADLVW